VAETGEQHVAALQHDLKCPACEYNLRGLRGDVVQCPECGETCDIAKLIATRWTLPWHRAPRLSTIYMPVVVAVLSPIAFLFATLFTSDDVLFDEQAWAIPMLVAMVVLFGWGIALFSAYRVFNGNRGVTLALISHLLLIAYMAGVVAFIGGGVTCVRGIGTANMLSTLLGGLSLAAGVLLFWLGRRGEKYVAGWCIRRHLQLQSAAD